jgi:hypothetical protein
MADVLEKIMAAHGGLAYWESLAQIDIEMSVSGLLFTTKRVPTLQHVRLSLNPHRSEVTMHNYPVPGQSARFDGAQGVTLLDALGQVLEQRAQPRALFSNWRRYLYWDALDFAYFCSYAMWNYLAMPYLLRSPGVRLSSQDLPDAGVKLTARFPVGFPTHCEKQVFYFDAQGYLFRHDYTAEVVGSWATAVHLSGTYRQFGGLNLPTRKRVHPKFMVDVPLKAFTLVAIDLHNVTPYPKTKA